MVSVKIPQNYPSAPRLPGSPPHWARNEAQSLLKLLWFRMECEIDHVVSTLKSSTSCIWRTLLFWNDTLPGWCVSMCLE